MLMSQQKYCVVFRETQKSHIKLVGKLSDQCQDTLVQFGTFLGSTLSVDEYVNKFPTIQTMLTEYHVPMEVAFFLARPMFNHAINVNISLILLIMMTSPINRFIVNQYEYIFSCFGNILAKIRPVEKSGSEL